MNHLVSNTCQWKLLPELLVCVKKHAFIHACNLVSCSLFIAVSALYPWLFSPLCSEPLAEGWWW